ncbi:MAG: hypothetical protein OEM40_07980 [Acidimicrobiia bacterium]|nr:hypothetical protein [Acidimicrobiia bacterium]
MAVQGNDTYQIEQEWAKIRARKQALNGGFRIVIGGDPVDIQPGRLTFQQRRHIKQATGQSIDAWVGEIVTGAAEADVLAGFLYCGFYQRSELDADGHPISVDDVMAMVQTLDNDTPIEIQFLDADGEAMTADEVEAQMADEPEPVEARTTAAAERGGLTFDPDDPTMRGPHSTPCGPRSASDTASIPRTSLSTHRSSSAPTPNRQPLELPDFN